MYNQQQQQGMMNQPPYSQTSQPQPNVYIQQLPLQQGRDGQQQQNFNEMANFNTSAGPQYQQQRQMSREGVPEGYGYGANQSVPGGYNVGPNRNPNMYGGGMGAVASPPMVMGGGDQQQHYGSQPNPQQQQYSGGGVPLHRQSTFPPSGSNVRMVSPEMMGNQQYYTGQPGVASQQQHQQQYNVAVDFQQSQQQQQPNQPQMNRSQSAQQQQMSRTYSMQTGDMGSPAFVGSPQPQQQTQLPISAPNQSVSVMTSRPGVSVSTTPVGAMSVTQMNTQQYGSGQAQMASIGQVRLPLQQSIGKGAGMIPSMMSAQQQPIGQASAGVLPNIPARPPSQQQPPQVATLAGLVNGATPGSSGSQSQQQQQPPVRATVQPTYLQYLQNSELPKTPYGLCKIAREINQEIVNKTHDMLYALRSYQLPPNLSAVPTAQGVQEKQMKMREMLDYLAQLFKKLREINDMIKKANAELPEPKISPRDMIPYEDESVIGAAGKIALETIAKAKTSDVYLSTLAEHTLLRKELAMKTAEVNDVMDFLRDLTWEVNGFVDTKTEISPRKG